MITENMNRFSKETHFTSQEVFHIKNTLLHNKYFYTKILDVTNKFPHKKTSQVVKLDCKMIIMENI